MNVARKEARVWRFWTSYGGHAKTSPIKWKPAATLRLKLVKSDDNKDSWECVRVALVEDRIRVDQCWNRLEELMEKEDKEARVYGVTMWNNPNPIPCNLQTISPTTPPKRDDQLEITYDRIQQKVTFGTTN